MKNKISIIILTYNNLNLTIDCIESIRKYTDKNDYEIIVVDNNSTDDTKSWLQNQNDLKVIYNRENLGFPKGCNIGIKASAQENDILLLNNDTVVTTNWLTNLKKCLYSNSFIGAVGAVSNNGANLQACNFSYSDFTEMQQKASQNNISDLKKWEEKVCLIGYCMLIKREVLNKIGFLDEAYSPGYIEDNDLSLRIIESGYKLMLCHDSFIHHYLGTSFRKDQERFNQLILKNREYFENKWKFNVFEFDKNRNLSIFLAENFQEVLDYNCGIGCSSLRIKYYFPKAKVTGFEKNLNKCLISSKINRVVSDVKQLKENFYDTIYIGNSLEETESPIILINELKKYLKNGGVIIGEGTNIANLNNINLLLNDNWYYENYKKQNYFTKKDLLKMFQDLGFKNVTFYDYYLNDIDEIKFDDIEQNLKVSYYAYKFIKEKD